jgi:uncharacterized protein
LVALAGASRSAVRRSGKAFCEAPFVEGEPAVSIPVTELNALLQSMAPALNAGEYVFATLDGGSAVDLRDVVASIREAEGLSVVLEASVAGRCGVAVDHRFAWITLTVHSDLQAVGLTAAFASALGREGISCNVVAGHCHDHIFVPIAQADAAMTALRALQRSAQATG